MHVSNTFVVVTVAVMLGLNVTIGYMAFSVPPDYSINITPNTAQVYQGDSGSYNIDLSSLRGFSSQVRLRVTQAPEGVDAYFENNVTQIASNENTSLKMDFKVAKDAPAGLNDIIVEANGGGLVHTITGKINIVGTGRVVVIIQNFWFYPTNLTVRKGTDVTWINKDPTGHTATANDRTWDSKLLQQNQEYTFKFDKVGTYQYYCTPHPQMIGEVKVVD
jgi:plastocyanin